MLARGERDLLALAAERDGRYELAGRLRWGPDGMIGRLASQPPGSSRCYHGVRVDRAENGEWTVHHPPGSPRHANLNEVPGFSACDPNLASATLAADSIRGALTRVDGATLTPYRTRRSRNRLLGTDTTSLFVEGDLAAIGMAALRTDGGGYGAMARHPGELGGLMELGTHASRREAQEAIIAYLEAPETAVETVAAD